MDERTATMDPSSWSGSESPADDMERMSDGADKGMDGDPEGVWSPDIDQSFQEALAIYPPCGRRKIILSDEGKMYGRNELIARYIKLRTGKTRTRKQVSSHIQVLARRKSREFHTKLKDQSVKDKALQSMASMSSAQIVSATAIHTKLGLPGFPRPTFPGAAGFWQGMMSTGQPGSSQDVKPFAQQAYPIQTAVTTTISAYEPPTAPMPTAPAWQGRSIGTTKLRLVEFSAFLEQQRDPDSYNKHLFAHIGQTNYSYSDALLEAVDICQIYDKFPEKKGGLKELFGKGPHNSFFLVKFWADLNCNIQDDSGAFYGVSSQYESSENMTITCSTKVCSFGKQVVEKVEVSPSPTHTTVCLVEKVEVSPSPTHTTVCLVEKVRVSPSPTHTTVCLVEKVEVSPSPTHTTVCLVEKQLENDTNDSQLPTFIFVFLTIAYMSVLTPI
ncbi:transcriptional enhancer factor TEF-1 isoform X2 [Coregonus clupeaformis]|uniref:transcriptional enhancer factor TEF-1 isoform X2 n=1 Tax=Coregonus clupeaformis TaxID=59861 RepID=UPI001BDF91D3|nr:transcriptional enhancer factor TEF-1 isoform X2 [Coregonus clupeaformis]